MSISVKNGHHADLRNVETLPQKVDSDDDIDVAKTQSVDDFRSLNRIDFRVQMVSLNAHSVEIGGDLLSEFDGHHGDQASLALLDACVDLCE